MKHFFKLLPASLLASALLFTSCNKEKDAVSPEGISLTADAVALPYMAHTIGAYSVMLSDVAYGNNTTTYSYSIKRVGEAQANGLSHWIVQLPTCDGVTPTVTGATIDGTPFTGLAYSEGKGTGCEVAADANILKFDNLASTLSDGKAHTYNFTLDGLYAVGTGNFWVKFGNNCQSATDVEVPACKPVVVGCSLSMGYWFAKPNVTWPSDVTIGGKTYTRAEGVAIWNSSNKGGMKDAKMAMQQYSAIRLSQKQGLLTSIPADLQADLDIIDAYFLNLKEKPLANTLPANSAATAAAGAAGGRIGEWINNNHCD